MLFAKHGDLSSNPQYSQKKKKKEPDVFTWMNASLQPQHTGGGGVRGGEQTGGGSRACSFTC